MQNEKKKVEMRATRIAEKKLKKDIKRKSKNDGKKNRKDKTSDEDLEYAKYDEVNMSKYIFRIS
jgi:hypothetical protein